MLARKVLGLKRASTEISLPVLIHVLYLPYERQIKRRPPCCCRCTALRIRPQLSRARYPSLCHVLAFISCRCSMVWSGKHCLSPHADKRPKVTCACTCTCTCACACACTCISSPPQTDPHYVTIDYAHLPPWRSRKRRIVCLSFGGIDQWLIA